MKRLSLRNASLALGAVVAAACSTTAPSSPSIEPTGSDSGTTSPKPDAGTPAPAPTTPGGETPTPPTTEPDAGAPPVSVSCTPDPTAPLGGTGSAGSLCESLPIPTGVGACPNGVACTDDKKTWCPHAFSFNAGATVYESVKLIGGYQGDISWDTARAIPMTLSATKAGTWELTTDIRVGELVEFKFRTKKAGEEEQWATDPSQPTSGAFGNHFVDATANVQCDLAVAKCTPAALPMPGTSTACVDPGTLAGDFDWRDSVMYFAFVDRFANGDKANDHPALSRCEDKPGDYYGGDYRGIQTKIEEGYFESLGVNTLWLTVPFDNPEWLSPTDPKATAAMPGGHAYTGYHGYWPLDQWPEKIASTDKRVEEHFGTETELVELVRVAHTKGMKVVFDYAMVHVYEGSPVYKAHAPALDADGKPTFVTAKGNDGSDRLFVADAAGKPAWFWPDVALGDYVAGTGHAILPGADGKPQVCHCGSDTTNPCQWDGTTDNPTIGQRCFFQGYLPHWNYTVPDALAYSLDAAVRLAQDTEVDGFRLDAVKHIDPAWYKGLRAKLSTAFPMKRFYLVGETYDFGNRDNLKRFIDPKTMLDGQFDFPFRAWLARSVLNRDNAGQKATMKDFGAFLASNDGYYGCGAVMSPWIGNHDVGRPIHLAENSSTIWKEWDNGQDRGWVNRPAAPTALPAYERLANAYAVLYTSPGAPLVYYGDEYGMAGAGDPDNRRMLFGENGTVSPTCEQQYVFERVKRLGQARKEHPALRRGTRAILESGADVLVYSMTAPNGATGKDVVYVVVNASDAEQSACSLPPGAYHELLGATDVTVTDAVTVPARQTRLFVAK